MNDGPVSAPGTCPLPITSHDTIQLAHGAGGQLSRDLVRDEVDSVRETVLSRCPQADLLLLTGGTGVTRRDVSVEAVDAILDKRLDGFCELFRMLSFREIGARAMLSRAIAGVREQSVLFCLPGSPAAVRLALERLILPSVGHLVHLLGREGA